ncbi:MAG TPA: bifunctional folylpolyglutamate synthase/dihydrofolate synthase [Eubacteriaceae bacterium]|nr:bifunctional folylpolyglutamate synthase/dihydrofolate synthase [Eubacteriaceae bacterium]
MNYEQALEYIHGSYQFGEKIGLENITKLLHYLDNPHKKVKCIHVAGTNGKGSTCNMISATLAKNGYKTGLYTSPYLEVFTERIQINGKQIPKKDLADTTETVKKAIDRMVLDGNPVPSEFEIVTAIGFQYFYQEKVDIVVLEVGMGGRFDATNVIDTPVLSIITTIAMDHVQYLGDTIEKIAFEKTGVIKKNIPVVVYPQAENVLQVIRNEAQKKNAPIIIPNKENVSVEKYDLFGQQIFYQKKDSPFQDLHFTLSLLGAHQSMNALVALTALEKLLEFGYRITRESIQAAMPSIQFPGRFEKLHENPTIFIDGAHNISGFLSLETTLKTYFDQKVDFVLGILEDKDYTAMVRILLPYARSISTVTPNNPRALPAKSLAENIEKTFDMKEVRAYDSIKTAALDALASEPDDVVIFVGSLYMIGEARTQVNLAVNNK